MKHNKWIKWLTGVTGAVIFTGFVGYLSSGANGDVVSAAATGSSVSTQDNGSDQAIQDDVASQWQNEAGTDRGSMGDRRYGRASDSGTAAPDSGSSDSQLRTHAS